MGQLSHACRTITIDMCGKLTDLTSPMSFGMAYGWAGFADQRIGTRLACRTAQGLVLGCVCGRAVDFPAGQQQLATRW
jgi:hypothetical protein